MTYPNQFEIHQDAIYPLPQLHSANFDYLRVPRLNSGVFEAPHLSSVFTMPANHPPLLASQLAAQFVAQDRLLGADFAAPPPRLRGRTPARVPARLLPCH